jgi:hypothetical protein
MEASASLKGRDAIDVVWTIIATAAGFVLAGLLLKSEPPRCTWRKSQVEFTARDYYDR